MNDKYKILIVENELITVERIRKCLEKSGYSVDVTSTGEEAIILFKSNNYNLVLMDVHLDGKIDGVSAAQSITKVDAVPIIFITELKDKDIFSNAIEILPENYLLKPFSDNSILYAVELALHKITKGDVADKKSAKHQPLVDFVFVPIVDGYNKKLLFDDILYLKANGAYTDIFYDNKDGKTDHFYKVSISSNHVVEQLAYNSLIRVNRSYYININKIEKISSSSVFIQGKEISISGEYGREFKKKLRFFKYK